MKGCPKKIATTMPRKFEIDQVNITERELVQAGNMQELRSLNVYQKARSEENSKYDLTLQSLDLQDLMQLCVMEKSLSDPYLRYASDSNATMFSESTLRAVGPGRTLRGDATGNCCRTPAGLDSKLFLLYAFVVRVC